MKTLTDIRELAITREREWGVPRGRAEAMLLNMEIGAGNDTPEIHARLKALKAANGLIQENLMRAMNSSHVPSVSDVFFIMNTLVMSQDDAVIVLGGNP